MVWQDIAIIVLQFIIAGALLPTVLNKHKPAPMTSILDGSALVCLAIVFVTMNYQLSAIGAFLSAVLWFILLYQVIKIKRNKGRKKVAKQ